MADTTDVLMTLIEQHWEDMRHVEEQREAITNMILVIDAATIGFIAQKGFGGSSFLLCLLLVLLGIYGIVATLKLYERHQLHQERLELWYVEVDRMHPNAKLLQVRQDAYRTNSLNFPRIYKVRLHRLWVGFNICIIVAGVVLFFVCIATVVASDKSGSTKPTPTSKPTSTPKPTTPPNHSIATTNRKNSKSPTSKSGR
ncbi:hypothetical protein IAD21_02437 [Abditibacteriota bacterium]|nr:hypothetical protein IAD21_02437 [Abditibacteriota bacterium]